MGLLSSLLFKFIPGEGVSVVSDFELSRVHVEDGPDEDILELDAGVLAPFEEDSLVFYIVLDNPKKYHFDGVVLGVVGEVVGPDEGGVGPTGNRNGGISERCSACSATTARGDRRCTRRGPADRGRVGAGSRIPIASSSVGRSDHQALFRARALDEYS